MEIPFFSLERQLRLLEPELKAAGEAVFRSNNFIQGSFVEKFEYEFADFLKVADCVTCGNATDGLELVLRALEIGPGDEVIVPAFTWVSDAESVGLVGAKVIFAEISGTHYNIDCDKLEQLINPKTKAIIFTHLFGNTAGFLEVKKIAEKYDLKLIEDCAQAHGAVVAGSKSGTQSDAGVFSFYPTKNLGAYGDAGAVVTNNQAVADRLRLLRNHGQLERDLHVMEGRNSRMDELQAAYLCIKLKYLPQWNRRRTEIAQFYAQELKACFRRSKLLFDGSHVYHQFVIRNEERDDLFNFLLEKGIGSAIHYPIPLPFLKPYFLPSYESTFELSRKVANEVLSLPIWPELNDEEIEYIINSLTEFNHQE